MKLLFIAGREPSYPRVNIILKGLKQNNVEIKECLSSSSNAFVRYFSVLIKFIFTKKKDCDAIFVGFFGQPIVPIVKLFGRKKIIFDAFLSAYDTLVFDKKKVKEKSLLAKIFWHLDRFSCKAADKILVDTNQHKDYFVSEFGVPRNKIKRVLIGADDGLFDPIRYKSKKRLKEFILEFHGNFIPLQGAEYIIGAAKKLKKHTDIKFFIIGEGQTYNKCLRLTRAYKLKNVVFFGKKKPDEISHYVHLADIGLGIFGNTQKTSRVIPNKAYEVLAMRRPLLTANTPAAAELFEHKKNVFLCKAADSGSLAEAILDLKRDGVLRGRIAREGYKLFKKKCTPSMLGKEISNVVQELLS